MDFKGNPFGPMPKLMAIAEYVTKVHAICSKTGRLANYSFRKKNNDSLVMLGESEEYEPLSRESFFKAIISDNARKINVTVEEVLPKSLQIDSSNEIDIFRNKFIKPKAQL